MIPLTVDDAEIGSADETTTPSVPLSEFESVKMKGGGGNEKKKPKKKAGNTTSRFPFSRDSSGIDQRARGRDIWNTRAGELIKVNVD